MPVYEFECEDCGKIFELITIKSQKTAPCPECIGGPDDKPGRGIKVPSAANFVVKGYNAKNQYSKAS